MNEAWPWMALLGLGAFHGINPGMGWLFAVAPGLQEQRRSAVWNALPPIAVGHALSVGLVVALVALIHASIPYWVLRWIAAAVLIGFGVYRLVRARHPRWVGMRVGFRDLTLWSFLMASAHGAGLMLVPVFLGTMHQENLHDAHAAHGAHLDLLNLACRSRGRCSHPGAPAGRGSVAMVVYEKLGVRILQRAWFNFDLAWAVALVVSGFVTALV